MLPLIFLIIVSVSAGAVYVFDDASPQTLVLTIDVPNTTSATAVQAVHETLISNNVSATFFISKTWFENNVGLAKVLHQAHEVACLSDTRLALLEDDLLEDAIVSCHNAFSEHNISVAGFRAQHNDMHYDAYGIANRLYGYDSSTYENYGWFWEQQDIMVQQPSSSLLLLPLDDTIAIGLFQLRSYYYTLLKESRKDTLILRSRASITHDHLVSFTNMITYFQQSGVTTMSVYDYLSED